MYSRRGWESPKARFSRARSRCSPPALPCKSTARACGRPPWRSPWSRPPSTTCWAQARGRGPRPGAASGLLGKKEFGIDPGAVEIQAPMQMGTGRAPRHPDGADAGTRVEMLAGRDVDGAEMAVHADQPAAVVDEYRIAVEEELTRVDDRAGGGCSHGSAARRRDVLAAVRVAGFAVEGAARAEWGAAGSGQGLGHAVGLWRGI